MIKKLTLFCMTALLFTVGAKDNFETPDEQGKYDEWCNNLDLDQESLEDLTIYLGKLEYLIDESRTQEYRTMLAKARGMNIEHAVAPKKDVEDFYMLSFLALQNPILVKTLFQIACLIGLDTSYAFSNAHIIELAKESSSPSDQDSAIYLNEIKSNIKKCRACAKGKLRKKVAEFKKARGK